MRGQWLFLHVRGGNGWEWQRLDRESGEPLERSRELFATLRDCIADATTHGYLGAAREDATVLRNAAVLQPDARLRRKPEPGLKKRASKS